MKTRLVNIKSSKPYDVYIGRPSPFGNPFSHKEGTLAKFKTKTRKEAVEKYREWVLKNPTMLEKIKKLKGKRLGCWCSPLECHGDVIIEILENKRLF